MSTTAELDYTIKSFYRYLITTDGENFRLTGDLPPELIDLIFDNGSEAFQALVDDLYLGQTLNLNDTHQKHLQQLLPPDLTTYEAVFPHAISAMGEENFTQADLLLDKPELNPRWVELKLRSNHARCVKRKGDDPDTGEKLYCNVELSSPAQLEQFCLKCRSLRERDQRSCPLLSNGMNKRLKAKMAATDYRAWLFVNPNIGREQLVGLGENITLEATDSPKEISTSQAGISVMQNTREEPLVELSDYLSPNVEAAPERIPIPQVPNECIPDKFDLLGSESRKRGKQVKSKIDKKPFDPENLLDAPIVDISDIQAEIEQSRVTSAVKILQRVLLRIAIIGKAFAIKRDIAPMMRKLKVEEEFLRENGNTGASLTHVLAGFLAGGGNGIRCLYKIGMGPVGKRVSMSTGKPKILTDNGMHFLFLPEDKVDCNKCKWQKDCEIRELFYRKGV